MKVVREIIVRPDDGGDIRSEFDRFLSMAKDQGWDQLEVLFGFAWGSDAYEGNWIEEEFSPDGLKARVRELEADGCGEISSDDLFVTVPALGVQYKFCHENDLHLEGPPDSVHLEHEAAHFRALGRAVIDRTREENLPS
ncbi:MAG: hypothetical protein ACR2RV_21270 [Verrucomicrobiales bacterium]